jgi:hypothetical protein
MTAIGPYCPWPCEVFDDTCIHPPGCADVVAELRAEHLRRLDSKAQQRRCAHVKPAAVVTEVGSFPARGAPGFCQPRGSAAWVSTRTSAVGAPRS